MNHIYRSIWNEALGAWIAVSELAKGSGKCSSRHRKLLATGLLVCITPVWALPIGEQLIAGQATVSVPSANTMQIQQSSQKAVLNWQGFSIAPNETVSIQQPNANAVLLNRVVGQDASQIQGQLNANGQVYLVNPNGVVFSKTAQVDVGGLVATTHNINDADFMNGNNHFTQDGAKGTVENHGTINTFDGGVVALIGESVTNTGTINTPKGTVALVAGKTVDLDFKGDGLLEVKVTESALNAQITNKGVIQADGGRVVLTTKAAGQLIDTVINQEGIIRAQGLAQRNGEIILEAGHVSQTGTLDVSGENGGTVNVNAKSIVDAGTTNADGTVGNGGNINMFASDTIIQTTTANTHANGMTTGGIVHLQATNSVNSSGKLSATGDQGGTVDVVSNDSVVLAAADANVSGTKKGGLIRVGGDFHGANAILPNAKTTTIDSATILKADGGQGKVVAWSDQQTDYYGSISANKAGSIEVSSKGLLNYAGRANAGVGGSLLLDPKNIIIEQVFQIGPIGTGVSFATNIGGTTFIGNVDATDAGLTSTLANGTNVTLQANNDITLNSGTDIIVVPSSFLAGNLTLQAGRNIDIQSNINTGNGTFTAIAGDPGAIATDRDPGVATIKLDSGVSINAGTGKVILAAIGGNFINDSGSIAPITASQWLIYSTDPGQNTLNGMTVPNKHYAQAYTGVTPSYASTGNWFLYSVTPTLTVTPNSQTITAGDTVANFTPLSFAGFIDGDTSSTAGISGSATFNIDNFTGLTGSYNVAYLSGLASSLGYVFADNTGSINELTVIPVAPAVTPVAPAVIPVVLAVTPVAPAVKPVIHVDLDDSEHQLSQISPLQQSTVFLPWEHEKSVDDDALDIENHGIKLPTRLHRIIALSFCPGVSSH